MFCVGCFNALGLEWDHVMERFWFTGFLCLRWREGGKTRLAKAGSQNLFLTFDGLRIAQSSIIEKFVQVIFPTFLFCCLYFFFGLRSLNFSVFSMRRGT